MMEYYFDGVFLENLCVLASCTSTPPPAARPGGLPAQNGNKTSTEPERGDVMVYHIVLDLT